MTESERDTIAAAAECLRRMHGVCCVESLETSDAAEVHFWRVKQAECMRAAWSLDDVLKLSPPPPTPSRSVKPGNLERTRQ